MIRNVLDNDHRIPLFVRYMTVLHTRVSIHNKRPRIVRAEKAYISLPVATVSICQNAEKGKKKKKKPVLAFARLGACCNVHLQLN
jgi:hypothetical protein